MGHLTPLTAAMLGNATYWAQWNFFSQYQNIYFQLITNLSIIFSDALLFDTLQLWTTTKINHYMKNFQMYINFTANDLLCDDKDFLTYWFVDELETNEILNDHFYLDSTIKNIFILTPQFSIFCKYIYIQIYYCDLSTSLF